MNILSNNLKIKTRQGRIVWLLRGSEKTILDIILIMGSNPTPNGFSKYHIINHKKICDLNHIEST